MSATLATMSENGRIAAEGEQVEVDVDERHGDEDGEDGEQDDDDQRLRAVDDARADDVDRRHRDARSAVVKTLSHQPAASSPTKSEVA